MAIQTYPDDNPHLPIKAQFEANIPDGTFVNGNAVEMGVA